MNELSAEQKEVLVTRIRNILECFDVQDVAVILPFIMNNEHVKQEILKVVGNFIRQELELAVQ